MGFCVVGGVYLFRNVTLCWKFSSDPVDYTVPNIEGYIYYK